MRTRTAVLIAGVCLTAAAAARGSGAQAEGTWRVKRLEVVRGLQVPECLVADPAKGLVYISNIVAGEGAYWDDDGKGFISQMTSDGQMKQLRWLDSKPEDVLNAPKGMCVLGDVLYFSDNARLMRCPTKGAPKPEQVPLPGAKRLNDVATDGQAVYVSDIEQGVLYKVDPSGGHTVLKAPPGVNGVTCHQGRMWAVSWGLHEVYELDPDGRTVPKPFGLAEHFTNLDGIEMLDDGSFIVSDFTGNKVSLIAPDGKSVHTLVELESPADVGLDRTRGLLYVPQFMKDQAVVFKLERR